MWSVLYCPSICQFNLIFKWISINWFVITSFKKFSTTIVLSLFSFLILFFCGSSLLITNFTRDLSILLIFSKEPTSVVNALYFKSTFQLTNFCFHVYNVPLSTLLFCFAVLVQFFKNNPYFTNFYSFFYFNINLATYWCVSFLRHFKGRWYDFFLKNNPTEILCGLHWIYRLVIRRALLSL